MNVVERIKSWWKNRKVDKAINSFIQAIRKENGSTISVKVGVNAEGVMTDEVVLFNHVRNLVESLNNLAVLSGKTPDFTVRLNGVEGIQERYEQWLANQNSLESTT